MPPLQRLRVTRQNGEKRAPPLRGGGRGKKGCSHDGCTQADTPRFARERSEPAPSLGQPRVPFPPLSYGQRIRRRRGGSGTATVDLILPGELLLNGCASEPAEPAPMRT